MSKRVYVHIEGDPEFSWKAVIEPNNPKTFLELAQRFSAAFNSKFAASGVAQLQAAGLQLENDRRKMLSPEGSPHEVLNEGGDVFAVRVPLSNVIRTCSRNGCGKKFTDAENTENSCQFHPSGPLFHEGMKGWSCCSKRVSGFDEFMQIPGCAFGFHSAEAEKSSPVYSPTVAAAVAAGASNTASSSSAEIASPPSTASSAVKPPSTMAPETPKEIEIENDPEDAIIDLNTKCRRNGCHAVYKGPESKSEVCVHHPGVAIFHEATKYWSCCRPRAVEFDEFLKIEGCSEGRHKFLPFKAENLAANEVKCRYDFYQLGDSVVMNIYAKNVDTAASSINISPTTVSANVVFKDGKFFKKDFQLAAQVDVEKSKFEMLSTKIEIKLKKLDSAISWTRLENN
eukprot:TRINITY_DN8642_c0_g1_i1.p1 TRINITY_DN8642_c0_g1~~TRINITY_DN8642_c0_g1_i1.p1  ORF type:complete len:398 (+),score=78.77 TRINITY_DN8642_c0_g1_i1:89-1282(+)